MTIKQMSLGPLGTNCYMIIRDDKTLIIDPGGDADKVVQLMTKQNLTPVAIVLTHAHFDHIGGVDALRKHYNVEVYGHEAEYDWLNDDTLNGSLAFTGSGIVTSPPEHLLSPGPAKISSFDFNVLHTPGHSPGSLSLVFTDDEYVIGGDVLFNGGIGRTDLPGGDFQELALSIKDKLYTLPENYDVFPGHGPKTTIGKEKQSNPFVRG